MSNTTHAYWALKAGCPAHVLTRFQRADAELAALRARVAELTDALDMMRDEFQRIIACPGCNAEIENLANRAQLKLIQHVPVIVQRDNAEAEVSKLRARVAELEQDKVRLDWLEHQGNFSFGRCLSAPEDHDAPAFALSVGLLSHKKHFPAANIRVAIDAARSQKGGAT